jgi:hypothetical protein
MGHVTDEAPQNHVALAVHTPDLRHLTTAELQALRAKGQALVKDLRKKSMTLVFKEAELKDPWLRTLAPATRMTPEEKKAAYADLERRLLKHPDAFYLYAQINGVLSFDSLIQEELLLRAGPKT